MSTRGHHGLLMANAGGFAPGPPDPYFANVVSLCHFQGDDNDTAIVDQISGSSWTVGGGAKIKTSNHLFGASSLFMTDSNDKITSNSDSRFTMGTGDFTFELSVFIASDPLTSVQSNLLQYVSGTAFAIYYSGNTTLKLYAAGADRITGGPLIQGAFNRIAYSRVEGIGYLALGGHVLGTYADTNNYSGTQLQMTIGNIGEGNPPDHFFAESRITKEVGRFTSDYTPDTQPFGDSA